MPLALGTAGGWGKSGGARERVRGGGMAMALAGGIILCAAGNKRGIGEVLALQLSL